MRLFNLMMDEETLCIYTDELVLMAKEDQAGFIKCLEQGRFDHEALHQALFLAAGGTEIDWSRVFVLAVMGVQLNANN